LSICIFKLHIHAATNAVFIAFAVTVCFKVILPIGYLSCVCVCVCVCECVCVFVLTITLKTYQICMQERTLWQICTYYFCEELGRGLIKHYGKIMRDATPSKNQLFMLTRNLFFTQQPLAVLFRYIYYVLIFIVNTQ